MFIRTAPFWSLPSGAAAKDCLVYIGLKNTDPTIPANKLSVVNGYGGAAVSNPFHINSAGKPRNTNGEAINPYISENEYSLTFTSENGAFIDSIPDMRSDAVGASGGAGTPTVDAVLNNFTDALTSDMTDFNIVFIQSFAPSWEGTGSGPVGGFYAYRTGTLGTPSTGNPGAFFDSEGNQYKPADFQRLYAEMFGAITGIGNDSSAAITNMVEAAISLEKPCYFDGDIYYINTQSNIPAGYTLMSFYATKIDGDLAMYGNGNTIIKNTTPNNQQYLFWAEDVENLHIEGLILDANSSSDITGALYCAGVANAYLDCTIKNSGPLYLSGSTTRQTDKVRGNLVIESSQGFAISGKSAGFKSLDMSALILTSCSKGVEVTAIDTDGFGYGITAPEVNISNISGDCTNELYSVISGSVNFDTIKVNAASIFSFPLTTTDVDLIYGNSIVSNGDKVFTCTSTTSAKINSIFVDNIHARGVTTAFEFDNALQVVGDVVFNYVDIDGTTNGMVLGDDTQLGNITINGGTFGAVSNGIVINQTNGQNLRFTGLSLGGTTTIINDSSKSKITSVCTVYNGRAEYDDNGGSPIYTLSGLIPSDWSIVYERGSGNYGFSAILTHNLGHKDLSVSASGIDPNAPSDNTGACQVYAAGYGNKRDDDIRIVFSRNTGASSSNVSNTSVSFDFTVTSAWN